MGSLGRGYMGIKFFFGGGGGVDKTGNYWKIRLGLRRIWEHIMTILESQSRPGNGSRPILGFKGVVWRAWLEQGLGVYHTV